MNRKLVTTSSSHEIWLLKHWRFNLAGGAAGAGKKSWVCLPLTLEPEGIQAVNLDVFFLFSTTVKMGMQINDAKLCKTMRHMLQDRSSSWKSAWLNGFQHLSPRQRIGVEPLLITADAETAKLSLEDLKEVKAILLSNCQIDSSWTSFAFDSWISGKRMIESNRTIGWIIEPLICSDAAHHRCCLLLNCPLHRLFAEALEPFTSWPRAGSARIAPMKMGGSESMAMIIMIIYGWK